VQEVTFWRRLSPNCAKNLASRKEIELLVYVKILVELGEEERWPFPEGSVLERFRDWKAMCGYLLACLQISQRFVG
jgi:hypothetical protein